MTIIKKLGGIFYGWWIVAASLVLFTFVGGTTFYGFTAFFNPIVTEMGWTRAQTSLAFPLRSIEGGGSCDPFLVSSSIAWAREGASSPSQRF